MITAPKKDGTRLVALDGDKLGLIAGSVVGLAVMLLCFYWQEVDAYTAFYRVGWSFVVTYGATYFFVRLLLRITLFEFVVDKRKGGARLRDKKDSGQNKSVDEPPESGAE